MPVNFFTPLRVCLALIVAIEHIAYFQAGKPNALFELGHTSPGYFAVNAFFIISGFLITASAERSGTAVTFFRSRALRILPALGVIGVVIAFVLGPHLTRLSLPAYVQSYEVWDFTLQLLTFRDPMPPLPGIDMSGNAFAGDLTGPIWTLRYEALAYIGTGMLLILGWHKIPLLNTILATATTAAFIIDLQTGVLTTLSPTLGSLVRFGSCYLYGVGIYLAFGPHPVIDRRYARIAIYMPLFGALLIYQGHALGEVLINIGLTIALFWVAYLRVDAPRWFSHPPDISYGLYICHWPIYQALTETIARPPNATLLAFVGLPLAVIAASLSWFLIEKPALALKAKPALKPV